MSIVRIKAETLTAVEAACENVFGQKPETLKLGYPPKVEFGDFAVECFPLAKQFRQNPAKIAQAIAAEIQPSESIQGATAVGPYLNFKIYNRVLFGAVSAEIIREGADFGNSDSGRCQRVMVEYMSPNTNKPLHLGHIRNGVLGMAVSNLLEATGHTVVKANLVNDRGVHICKSMLAWLKWANGATPESTGTKGDHFVGDWYVRYAKEAEKDPSLEVESQQMLRKWEDGDPETLTLWKTMNEWVYDGFSETYQKLGLEFDVFYYESDTYKLGKDIIQTGLEKGVFFQEEDGAIVANLPVDEFGTDKDGSPKKVTVLRGDGTSVYITQDLGTAQMKLEEHQLDRSIYVVASEQNYHFQCLFKLLDMLDFDWASGCYHLSYGMVNLPEGKMKSREGRVVDADDLIEEMRQLAEDEIRGRDPDGQLSTAEIQKRALTIGLAAIKFYLLRARHELTINFDPKESISFDGFTGPYCQYAYARCASILRNAQNQDLASVEPDFSLLGNEEELQLIRALIQFPEELAEAAQEFTPARICNRLFTTAQALNQFYHKHSVLSAEDPALVKARLALVHASAIVIKKALALMGIETLEVM
ncbi:MAG: arginine--tRNA ligase [Candidatus Poribacteria bacterium]|nr:arginine--tRNA ligase [Candidatus Poribacteria bacterium]